jgi:hypothetical protein
LDRSPLALLTKAPVKKGGTKTLESPPFEGGFRGISTNLQFFIAVAKAIKTKANPETLTPQSFPFCLLPSVLGLLL